MADPRYYVDEMNESYGEQELGNGPRAVSSDEDIRQTAHFTHPNITNEHDLQDSFRVTDSSPIHKFQPIYSNNQQDQNFSIQNSTAGLEGQFQNGGSAYTAHTQQQNNFTAQYRPNQSSPTQVQNGQTLNNQIYNRSFSENRAGSQPSHHESQISQQAEVPQQNLAKLTTIVSQPSQQSQNTQYSHAQQMVQLKSDGQRVIANTMIKLPSQQSQQSYQSQNSQSANQAPLQKQNSQQVQTQNSQSQQQLVEQSSQTHNIPQLQADNQSINPSSIVSSQGHPQNQYPNLQSGQRQTNQAVNYVQNNQPYLYNSQQIQKTQGGQRVLRQQTFENSSTQNMDNPSLYKQSSAPREPINPSLNTSSNPNSQKFGILQPTSPVNNPNRFFPGSSTQQPSVSQQIPKAQTPVVQNLNANRLVKNAESQLIHQSQSTPQLPNAQLVGQNPSIVSTQPAQQVNSQTIIYQNQGSRGIVNQKPQSVGLIQGGLGQQSGSLRQTIGVTSPVNAGQRPSFFHNQIIANQNRQLNASRSNSPNAVGDRERKSLSYGSSSSKQKPPVFFTYLSNIHPAKPIPIPAQPQVQVIRQHTHSHTVVQKTVTVVWQYRYWTVIQKFNFIAQRFNQLTNELRVITQILQNAKSKQNFQTVYRDLLMRHTLLLQILSETQYDLSIFEEKNNQYKKQIQYEAELKQQALYKDKCKLLEQENGKLRAQLQRITQQLQITKSELQKISINANSQSSSAQLESKVKAMEEELIKSQTLNNELMNYIRKLESDNNGLAQQLERAKAGQMNGNQNGQVNSQHIELIKNQQLIIRELENALKKSSQQPQQDTQQFILLINQLQARVNELQQNDQAFNPQYSERKYTQIIETQRNIIQNIQHHFKEFTESANVRQEELKGILQNQQNIIHSLEEQIKKTNANVGQVGGVSKQREQALLQQIQNYKVSIRNLQSQLQREGERVSSYKQQIIAKTQQINQLNQQKIAFQTSMEAKLQQKLTIIEQQLKLKGNTQSSTNYQTQPQSPNNSRRIQQLSEEVQRLNAELKRRLQQKRSIEEQLTNQSEAIRRKLLQKESEGRLMIDKIKIQEQEYIRKLQDKDRKAKYLEEQIESLNYQLKLSQSKTPRRSDSSAQILSPTRNNDQQLRSLKDKLAQRQQQLNDAQRQRQNTEKKYQTLQISSNTLQEQISRKTQQLMGLKRQLTGLSNYQSQIKTLSETVSKKNQQILQLKSVLFERNQLRVEIQSIKNERNVSKNTIQSKNQQIENLRQAINELQAKLRQTKLKQSLFPNTNESVADQLQLMYDSNKKKQMELTKLRQTIQLLQTNVQQLQYELEKAKGKLNITQKNLAHEKDEGAQKSNEYQIRIREFETRIKSMEQNQRQSKTNLQQQLQSLDALVKQKQDIIRKLESESKVLKNKLKNHDSKVQEVDFEREALNNKIKQLQTMREDMKKKINTLEQSGQNNNKKLYDEYQIKIVELQSEIKLKDNKIKQLQNIIETIKIKATHNNQTEDDFINQQQIQVLRKKIAQYESRLYSQTNAKTTFPTYNIRDYQSTYVFQQKVIYDLKSENQRLKSMLSGKGFRYNEESPSKGANVQFIQKRLIDFNQKLQEMIEENRNLEERHGDFSGILGQKHNHELLLSFERERNAILRKHRGEISALQARMVDLQRYCSSLQNFQGNSIYNVTSTTKNITNQNIKGVYSQQLAYYKEKNKQLEERIDSHIKLNRELKDKLQGLLKNGGSSQNSLQFYKIQASQYEKQIAEYLARIKSLTQQNNNLSKNLSDSRRNKQSQDRIAQLEGKINELNRKIAQLQMQNGILQADLSKYTDQIKRTSDQILRYKTGGQDRQQKIISLQSSLRQANNKISAYQTQIVKLTNQIKILEAEIERLNQKSEQRLGQENGEISRLKGKISQLQSQLRQFQEHSITWSEAKLSYEQTITMLNNRIGNLDSQIARLNSLFENLNKKARDTDNDFYELENKFKVQKNRAAELEAALKRKQNEIDEMNEFLQRMKKQRDNEGGQSKQRLAYITEMEQTIKSLRVELAQYKMQLERLRSESVLDKKRLGQMNTLQQTIKQLRMEIQKLKAEIQRLKLQNSQLRKQSGMSASVLEGLTYRLEFLRSSFIEIQVLVGEVMIDPSNLRQTQVIRRVRRSTQSGLKICSQTFALL